MTVDGSTVPVGGQAPTDAGRWWALGFVLTGYPAVFAGVTIMNVALPAAQSDLGFADAARQLVITLNALCYGALMVPAGRLGDVIGLPHCFIIGMAGFGATSLLGGLAGSTALLLTQPVPCRAQPERSWRPAGSPCCRYSSPAAASAPAPLGSWAP